MAAIEPMEQFLVHKVVDLPPIPVPGLGMLDMSITNSVMFMLIAAILISGFFFLAARRQIVPGRMQALAEMLYNMVDGTLTGGIIGDRLSWRTARRICGSGEDAGCPHLDGKTPCTLTALWS